MKRFPLFRHHQEAERSRYGIGDREWYDQPIASLPPWLNRFEVTMHVCTIPLFVLSILLAASPGAKSQTPNNEDDAAIRAIVQSETDAWNRGDAEAFGAHYAEDGSFTNVIGQQAYGRKAFIAQHAMIFSTIYKGSHNVFTVGKIKFLRPDVAIVDIDGVLTGAVRLPPGMKPDPDGATRVKLQEVMTKEKGSWWVASFHNVAVTPLPPRN